LLLPAETSAQQVAENEADEFRDRLIGLQAMQALAAWLDHRPQLGRDVFARGQPEYPGTDVNPGWQVDVVAFLWASLALFDDDTIPGLARTYRPQPWDLHTVEAARERILRRLAEAPDGMPLERLLPSAQSTVKSKEGELRWRSAWASTLVASLELAKQGDVVLTQTGDFQDIQVSAKAGRPAAEGQ
jgi:segregation and condensation protein A